MKRFFIFTMVLCILMLPACTKNASKHEEVSNHKSGQLEEVEAKNVDVTLYYADSEASKLCPEVRRFSLSEASDPKAILQELFKGTEKEGLVNTIPPETVVNSCSTQDGVCTVDLSADFVSKRGTAYEQMSIYSVVNTLCLLDGIDEVQFLIDGEKQMIFGNYIFDEPFTADQTITE